MEPQALAGTWRGGQPAVGSLGCLQHRHCSGPCRALQSQHAAVTPSRSRRLRLYHGGYGYVTAVTVAGQSLHRRSCRTVAAAVTPSRQSRMICHCSHGYVTAVTAMSRRSRLRHGGHGCITAVTAAQKQSVPCRPLHRGPRQAGPEQGPPGTRAPVSPCASTGFVVLSRKSRPCHGSQSRLRRARRAPGPLRVSPVHAPAEDPCPPRGGHLMGCFAAPKR